VSLNVELESTLRPTAVHQVKRGVASGSGQWTPIGNELADGDRRWVNRGERPTLVSRGHSIVGASQVNEVRM